MNELDGLRRYYDQVDGPAPEVLAGMRRDFLERTTRKSTSHRAVRRGLIASAAVGLAAIATVAVAAVTAPAPVGGTGKVSGAATLELVASRADAVSPLTVVSGKYVYTRYRSEHLSKAPVPGGVAFFISESIWETWSSVRQPAPVRIRTADRLNARPLNDVEAAKLRQSTFPWQTPTNKVYETGDAPPPDLGQPGPYNPTPRYLASLPTDAKALTRRLLADLPRVKPGQPGELDSMLFHAAANLATNADALLNPALRSALYRAMATLPGIESVPGQVDLAGRTGIGIGLSWGNSRYELIIDETTLRAIGTRSVLIGPMADGSIPAGTVLEWSTTDQMIVPVVGATN